MGDLPQELEPIGRLQSLDDVTDKALEYFAAVPEEALSDDELFSRSQSLNQLGQVRMAQGNMDAALEAFGESLELASAPGDRDPDNGECQVGLGASHFYVGYVHWQGRPHGVRAGARVASLRETECGPASRRADRHAVAGATHPSRRSRPPRMPVQEGSR